MAIYSTSRGEFLSFKLRKEFSLSELMPNRLDSLPSMHFIRIVNIILDLSLRSRQLGKSYHHVLAIVVNITDFFCPSALLKLVTNLLSMELGGPSL